MIKKTAFTRRKNVLTAYISVSMAFLLMLPAGIYALDNQNFTDDDVIQAIEQPEEVQDLTADLTQDDSSVSSGASAVEDLDSIEFPLDLSDMGDQLNVGSSAPDSDAVPFFTEDSKTQATDVPDDGIMPLDLGYDGWTAYTGLTGARMISFNITTNSNLTGWLGKASPSAQSSNYLYSASYYIRYNDGQTTADITYAYYLNNMGTSGFYALIYNGSSYAYYNIGATPVNSIWYREVSPGYTALMLQGRYNSDDLDLDVRVIMTPNNKGTVQYNWQITNLDSSSINLAAVFMIDTELQGVDSVPVYSAGTNNGMYIDTTDAKARVYFPYVSEANGGPYDYAAGNWANGAGFDKITNVYGANLDIIQNRDVPREVGDVLVNGVDSEVVFRYLPYLLSGGETRDFVYRVSLGEPDDIPVDPTYHTVSFDSDGGSSVDSQEVEEGDLATRPANPTRSHYTFAGWYLDGVPYDFSAPVTEDIELVAHWTPVMFNVTYKVVNGTWANGTTADLIYSVQSGNSPTNIPTGMLTSGIYDQSSGSWDADPATYGAIAGTVTFTFSFAELPLFTVSFDSAGGSAVTSQSIRDGSTAIRPTIPTRDRFVFVDWYLGGVVYDFTTPVTDDIELTAHWTPVSFTVLFVSTVEREGESQSIQDGLKAIKPADPHKDRFVFTGWYLEDELYDFDTPVTDDITLTARWERVSFVVTFNSAGGSAVPNQSVVDGQTATRPANPTRDKYTFDGWYLGDRLYDFSAPVTENITLTAHWSPVVVIPRTGYDFTPLTVSLLCLCLGVILLTDRRRRLGDLT